MSFRQHNPSQLKRFPGKMTANTILAITRSSKGPSRFEPELHEARNVLLKDTPDLIAAIHLYKSRMRKWEESNADLQEEMGRWGAPVEDFRDAGRFQSDVQAFRDVMKAYPDVVKKYFVTFSPKYGKEAPHGMGRYDKYGGL